MSVSPLKTQRIVEEASSTVTYVGFAPIGTATSVANWVIMKIEISGSQTIIKWAGVPANVAWDDRATLSYT